MSSTECRKFAPNIFNKSKCSNCFRLKEDHSASAIELNKASRKISKCGYLFVAPDWDFSNPINRTKRWQRRWFVLYDDGELTYSVDDHPETIPQACIDMNKVMEVARADEITGNPYSVAITAPERVHFVKGTCKEESNWWLEVLQIFPRSSIKTGRAKRNATFPGGVATTYRAQYSGSTLQTPPVKCDTEKDPEELPDTTDGPGVTEPTFLEPPILVVDQVAPASSRMNTSLPLLEPSSPILPSAGRFKKIKTKPAEGTRAYRSLRSNTCENLSAIPQDYGRSKLYRYQTESPERENPEIKPESPKPTACSTPILRIEQDETKPEPIELEIKSPSLDVSPPWSRTEGSEISPSRQQKHSLLPTELPVRGVPDGCGLEISSLHSPVPIPSPHELLNLKKGWLMKQGMTKDWQKHWFVLQGSAIMYFKDPESENNGLMDGIIDLGLVQKVEERDVQRNYGFVISTLDDRDYILSAVTHGIRNNWINALKTASNLNTLPESDTPKVLRRDILETDIKISRRNTADSISLSTPPPSEGTGRIKPEHGAPISPPLNRTPTSRLKKEKSRTGRTMSLKNMHPMSSISSSSADKENRNMLSDEDLKMIPERDISNCKPTEDLQGLRDSPILGNSISKNLESAQTDFFLKDPANQSDVEPQSESRNIQPALRDTNLLLARQTIEINNLRTKLDNMNADMDATLKNLNTEQVRNTELGKKVQDLEQENSLLHIKSTNAEKSLREQSKEITSLNEKVREFSDLSSQYKAQVAENKTLRQKMEKIERINSGPNWKTLYDSLQTQHQKERVLWGNKLKEMEHELQNLVETNSEAEQKGHLISDLSHQLQESETRINQLVCQNDTLVRENKTLTKEYENEMHRMKENIKELEEYIDKTDVDKCKEEKNKDAEIVRLRQEISERSKVELEKAELESELARTRGEVEMLTTKLIGFNDATEKDAGRSRSLCSSRDNLDKKQMRMVRMDSLTELMAPLSDVSQISNMEHDKLVICYNDVVNRFNKAISEIKALKSSVKQAQSNTDAAEIKNLQICQNLKNKEIQYGEEMKMLSNKIEDLTSKYLSSERQVRNLKLKLKGPEGKERRRSSTGVRPDELIVHREAEYLLDDIESSLNCIDGFMKGKEVIRDSKKKSYETSTKASRARRRSCENMEISFVERLKRTEKTLTEVNRRLSTHGDNSHLYLENLRKQMISIITRTREEMEDDNSLPVELKDLLNTLESVITGSELPGIYGDEPGFPNSDSISSHFDTVMSFLYRSVEDAYELRKEFSGTEIAGTKISSFFDIGAGFGNGAEVAKIIKTQETSLQAYLLMDLQQQISTIQTRVFAGNREQTLKDYNDVTKSLLLKVLESKQFVPLSSHTCKKLKALSSVSLSSDALTAMFRRLKREAQVLFSRIGAATNQLLYSFLDSISSQAIEKDIILDGIRSEVYNMIEEDERMREFQTSLVNIYLICSDSESDNNPERVNLMANREEALQSQTEVTRILIDQEIQDFSAALHHKIEEGDTGVDSLAPSDAEDLNTCMFKIASMIAQKCVTEAQITILNTILGLEEKDEGDMSEDGEPESLEDFALFDPMSMNNECNEFMLVLNTYRQTQSRPRGAKPRLSLTGQSGNTLESNLRSIRRENENKKARLSAALSEKKTESSQDDKYQDLRVWCEKSMTAMEKSYENLLGDLQQQHLKEKDSLKKEKEQALAEETKATLSALDAMRKAHESEVQKEVEKFKKEFLSELRNKECIGALQSEYQEDRDEIKREILSVTGGDGWQDEETRASRLTRSPSCPRLYSTRSFSTPKPCESEEPLKSPLTGMVANRKRVFETEY